MIITAAWTGNRWGELVGLHQTDIHRGDRCLLIDGEIGALHESCHRGWLGPPNAASSARTIPLPPFPVACLV